MSMTLNGTSGLVFPDSSTQNTAATGFGFKNRIINGAMMIDQRNAGASVTATTANLYSVDRWKAGADVSSKYSIQQVSDAPTGFSYSAKVTSSSAYTVGSTETFGLLQWIEGYNIADLMFGSAGAQTITLSFWVKSSLTGTFGGSLQNSGYTSGYPFSYTISSANTWEYKTVTITGSTSGTWNTTNGAGIGVYFSLGSGASRSNTAGAWTTTQYSFGVTGATSVVGTNGATFYITGVQLEKGSTATSFDYRPYGTELALCQRYFNMSYAQGTAPGSANSLGVTLISVGTATTATLECTSFLKAEMRTTPTITLYDGAGASGKVYRGANGVTGTAEFIGTTAFSAYSSGTSSLNQYYHWTASAEL